MNKHLFILGVLAFSGCASTKVVQLGAAQPAKPENCEIQILTQPPKKDFEEVCLLTARGGQSIFESKSVEGLLPDLKKKACACGADAIIMKNAKEGGYNFAGPADRAEASVTAIKFK
jgi:hypothetical protein